MQTVNVNSRVYELGTCHRMIQYRVLSQDVNLYQEQDAAAQLPALAGGTGTPHAAGRRGRGWYGDLKWSSLCAGNRTRSVPGVTKSD